MSNIRFDEVLAQPQSAAKVSDDDLATMWPQAAGELWGFARHLSRSGSGLTAAQIVMAVLLGNEVAALRAELHKWRPMTPEEAQKAYDEAEAVPLSQKDIDRIMKFATDPANRCTNDEQAQMVGEIRRKTAQFDKQTDETRQLIVEMRKYVVYHGVLIGECVAWNKLKEMYGIGDEGIIR